MKRVTVLSILLLILSFPLFTQNSSGDLWFVLSLSEVMIGSGFTTEIHANSGSQNLSAYGFDITFDHTIITPNTSLGTDSVEPGSSGFVSAVNPNTQGLLLITGFDAMGTGPDADLHVLTINWNADNLGNTILGLTVRDFANPMGEVIGNPNGIAGSVQVIEGSTALGDVNEDGRINIIDGLLVSQYYVGLYPVNFNPDYADVDGNSLVNILDALLIAQFYIKLITEFPGDPQVNPSPIVTPDPAGIVPEANFTVSNYVPAAGETVIFDATTSTDEDGTIERYNWDFDDGTFAAGPIVDHFFEQNDDFKVTLAVVDNNGLTSFIEKRVFVGRPQGWTEETHHKSASPNYDILFPEDLVNRIDITISEENFQVMEDDLAILGMWSDIDPIYVTCTVEFNGYTWQNVGIRYKGQSSLFAAGNSHKLPFRLHFDKFEDTYTEIDDQRLYGFEKMTFCSNWSDPSFLREKICTDIFRNGGLAAAYGAYIRVYIDTGNGPMYWGLYTNVEDPSDALLKIQFSNKDGNLYKPKGTGADWTTPFRQEAFIKKTNEDLMDFSDVQAVHAALHASRSDAVTWRMNLEATFNTDIFLRWLAINTTIVNWDSYGLMAQNYYVYQDLSDNGRLVWIPWDHNLSLTTSAMMGGILSLSLDEVGSNWPLIRYLMDEQVYRDIYHQEMQIAIYGCFDEATVVARMQHFHDLIRPYVVGPEGEISGYTFLQNGESEFDSALNELINHVQTRQQEVTNYLSTIP